MKIETPWGVREVENPCAEHADSEDLIVGESKEFDPPRWIYQCHDCKMIWIEGEGPKILPDNTPATYDEEAL